MARYSHADLRCSWCLHDTLTPVVPYRDRSGINSSSSSQLQVPVGDDINCDIDDTNDSDLFPAGGAKGVTAPVIASALKSAVDYALIVMDWPRRRIVRPPHLLSR